MRSDCDGVLFPDSLLAHVQRRCSFQKLFRNPGKNAKPYSDWSATFPCEAPTSGLNNEVAPILSIPDHTTLRSPVSQRAAQGENRGSSSLACHRFYPPPPPPFSMSNSNTSDPPLPSPKASRPVSEALLNEKVSKNTAWIQGLSVARMRTYRPARNLCYDGLWV
jgi:hypothetical protein